MKKRILYFIPDNPFWEKSGNRTRFLQLLDYLASLSTWYEVELISIGDHSGVWEEAHKSKFVQRYPEIKLHILNRKGSKANKIKYFLNYKIPTAIPKLFRTTTVDVTNFILRNKVRKLVRQGNFDMVIASYASWARVFDGIDSKITKIIDTHDFLAAQHHRKKNKIGKLFQSEMDILNKFDVIWTYSSEEAYIFEQFTKAKVMYLPTSAQPVALQIQREHVMDVLYIASANRHNIKSAQWLYEKVLPHLGAVKIHVIGAICHYMNDHPKIIKHGIIEDLSSMYQRSKMAICPMLSGTGIKIKVIEALSYSLPVVTTRRGVDGLLNKINNGCIVTANAQEFADTITRLVHDEGYYEQHRLDAKNYYDQCHTPSLEKKVLDSIFLDSK